MIILALIVISLAAADDVCVPAFKVTPIKSIPVPDGISYFIRSAPGSREISFGSIDKKVPSQVVNVDSGLVTPVDGNIDPVLSPDGALLTVPHGFIVDGQTGKATLAPKDQLALPRYQLRGETVSDDRDPDGKSTLTKEDLHRQKLDYAYASMIFYARQPGGGFKMIHAIDDNDSNYQSLGKLPHPGPNARYRMLYKGDQVGYQDFAFTASGQKLEALGPRRIVCTDAMSGDMPMISKDGSTYSVFVEGEQVVHTYNFDDYGTCRPRDTLPSMTGKVDFSPNGKLLAFQMDEAAADGQTGAREFERPTKDQKLRAYAYDRETKRLTTLSNEPGGHTYFPVFVSDTEIAYAHASEDTKDNTMQIKLVRIEKNDVAPASCPTCDVNARVRQASALLAKLYAARCKQLKFQFDDTERTLGLMTPQVCQRLVDRTTTRSLRHLAADEVSGNAKMSWNPNILQKLKKEDVRDVCRRIKVPVRTGGVETKSSR